MSKQHCPQHSHKIQQRCSLAYESAKDNTRSHINCKTFAADAILALRRLTRGDEGCHMAAWSGFYCSDTSRLKTDLWSNAYERWTFVISRCHIKRSNVKLLHKHREFWRKQTEIRSKSVSWMHDSMTLEWLSIWWSNFSDSFTNFHKNYSHSKWKLAAPQRNNIVTCKLLAV